MIVMLKFATFLLTAVVSQGLQYNDINEGEELPADGSKYGSLWPLPQNVKISETAFKLSSVSFQIVDSKQSSAGPSCSLLQNAFRR